MYSGNSKGNRARPGLCWTIGLVVLMGIFLVLLLLKLGPCAHVTNSRTSAENNKDSSPLVGTIQEPRLIRPGPRQLSSPAEIVNRKLAQFGRSRRALAYELAKRHNVVVPGDVERFFDAVESGNWVDIKAAFDKISAGEPNAGGSNKRSSEVSQLWPAIIDAYGVAEQVHLWPAQKLLDYGNAVLDALRPGMVYVGGTDNGRWVPELLNETSDGERHIVITQNGLAAGDYLDYLRLQYDDRMSSLSEEDSQRGFQSYIADAQKRLEHDQQHPDVPKQILPGEDVKMENGKVTVSGLVAVMAINQRLLQSMMEKNPSLSFAIQESFPLRTTYADAMPLGPLMELNAGSAQGDFSAQRASDTLNYWRTQSAQILADADAAGSDTVLRSYSHDTASAANLLASHEFVTQAEEAYRLATQLWPKNPESISGLANILNSTGRQGEAQELLDTFARKYPDQVKDLERFRSSVTATWTVPARK